MHPDLEQTYTIKSLIGQGGMSRVYLAEHRRLQTRWAVKEVSKHQGARFDFLAEANILKQLQHPMLPRIVDIFETDSHIYIVEDFVEGMTLEAWLEEKGKADEALALEWMRALCGVLLYLHSRERPIIYRDMKPSNIMLQPDGSLKLIDFGIAREYKADAQGDTTYIGTQGYAAPEQFGKAQTDARTDIYSLGVTLYHLVTGKSPYEPPYQLVPARQLEPKLSHGLEYILGRCTQPEPEARYGDIPRLLEDVQHIYRFDRAYIRFRRQKRARRAVLALMLTASLALMASGYTVMGQERRAAAAAEALRLKTEQAAAEQALRDEYDALLSEAASLLDSDPGAAIPLLEQAREKQADRVEAYGMQAFALYMDGRDAACVQWTQDSLLRFPGDSDLQLIGASAYFNLADYAAAAEYFRLGAQGSELSADHLRDYAVSLGRLGQLAEAEAALDTLAGQGGSPPATAYVRGELAYARQDYGAAEAGFLEALAGADSDALLRRCYLSLAETYRDSGQQDKAIPFIENGLALPQLAGNTVLLELLGAACYTVGSAAGDTALLERAGGCFNQVIAAGVHKEYLFVNAFTAWQGAGDLAAAGAVLDDMKAVWPRSYTPYALGAMLLIMEENQKPQSVRSYAAAFDAYQAAVARVQPGDETSLLQQLEGLIDQLRAGNWIK